MKMVKLICVLILIIAVSLHAQVFNTSQTLKSGKWSLGLNPALHDHGDNEFGLFIHGGYGISRGMDLGLKLGFGYNETYFGADLEWVIRGISPYISISAGGHSYGDVGLDATMNFTFPINKQVHLYTGFDFDLIFIDRDDNPNTPDDEGGNDTVFPVWLFVGTEVGIRHNMTLLLEVELEINDAYSIFGGGINFYF